MAEAAPGPEEKPTLPPLSIPIADSEMTNVTDDKNLRVKVGGAQDKGCSQCPRVGQRVDILFSSYREDKSCIEHDVSTSFILGNDHCIQAFDLCVRHMKKGQEAVVKSASDYAFGMFGSRGVYAPNQNLYFKLTLLNYYDFDYREEMPFKTRIKYVEDLQERGNHLYVLKEYRRAVEIYATAIIYMYDTTHKSLTMRDLKKIQELHASLYVPMMCCYSKMGNVKRCHKAAEKVLIYDCTNVKALFLKGRSMVSQGDKKGGLDFMEQALRLKPQSQEMKDAINEVREEIQTKTTTARSRRRCQKRRKRGKLSCNKPDQDTSQDNEKKTVIPNNRQNIGNAGDDQHILPSGNNKTEAEIITVVQNIDIIESEIKNKAIPLPEDEQDVTEKDIRDSVDEFMQEVMEQVVLAVEEREKLVEKMVIKKSIENLPQEIINKAFLTAARKQKEEVECKVTEPSMDSWKPEVNEQIIDSAEENKGITEIFFNIQGDVKQDEDGIHQAIITDQNIDKGHENQEKKSVSQIHKFTPKF